MRVMQIKDYVVFYRAKANHNKFFVYRVWAGGKELLEAYADIGSCWEYLMQLDPSLRNWEGN